VQNRLMGAIFAGAAALLLLPAIFAQTANQSKVPGSAPDLTGVWQIDHFQASLFPKGNAPLRHGWRRNSSLRTPRSTTPI